jgi:predicted permease
MLSDVLFRLRALFQQRAVEEELDDELRFHFDREVEKLERSGLARQEALRRARLSLGGLDPVKEECRQARGISALEIAVQDLRYALRGMRARPAFTIAAVLTLAFGAGAISTVFTLANTLFFRELPVDHPDRLVIVQATRRHGHWLGWVSYPDYVHFRDGAKTLEGLAAHYSTAPLFVTTANRSQELNGAVVSANYFPLLGLNPALGRFFRPDEDSVPDRNPVAVLSYALWRNWFGASPDVLGAALRINGTAFTVIGVAPPAFQGVNVMANEIYIPTMMARSGYRWCDDAFAIDCTTFDMIGRLRDGHTVEQARGEIATLTPSSWATAKEGENTGITLRRAEGVLDTNTGRSGQIRFIRLLAGVAAILLLVCCLNLAGLLIARNRARTREFAIRISLGAGSPRLMSQLITESLLLAIGGGVLGMLFSLVLTGALNSAFYSLDGEGHPLHYNFNPEPRVLLAVLAVSIAAGFLAGVIPALKSTRTGAAESLKRQGSAVSAGLGPGRWLAGAQAGVAVALAALAGLLATSAHTMITGIVFESSHVALMRLRPRLLKYPPEKAQQFLRTAIERLEAFPGVESASMVGNGAVLHGGTTEVSLSDWTDTQTLRCGYIEIAPRYFETLRTPLLRGREFDRRDTTQSQPVAIVSEALAKRLWPTGSVIGATLMVKQRLRQVVGIVKDIPWQPRGTPTEPYVYVPFWQNPAQLDARLCVRVKGDPSAILPALAREVNRVDPDVPIAETITLPMQTAGSISDERITAGFVSYAAVLAVLLSAIGLYGAMAFSVSRRTKEIGIRLAIGAKSASVLAMVIREGMTAVFVGVAFGVLGAMAGTRVVRHLLYGSGASDPQVYAVAVLVVAVVGLVACFVPARRAASVEPLVALREE